MVYLVFKPNSWKKALKVWRMGGSFFFAIIYIQAYMGDASYFIKSGQATVIGICFFAVAMIWDTIADWSIK